ncbi:MAG: hypothetical protein PHF67_05020 [Candidatus Nanoarchaeia archaeon]|nr:hypothetical protein [Candidatus Nanoarchaeia archaeon]
MERRLGGVFKSGETLIGNISNSGPPQVEELRKETKNISSRLGAYLVDYKDEIRRMRERTLDSIKSSYSDSRETVHQPYSDKPHSFSVQTGSGSNSVRVDIRYTPVEANLFLRALSFFWHFSPSDSTLEATIYHGIESERIAPLKLKTPVKTKRSYEFDANQITNETKIAQYTLTIVKHALAKVGTLGIEDPVGADVSEIFEQDVVYGIARLFQDNNIPLAYKIEIKKEEGNKILEKLIEGTEQSSKSFSEKLSQIRKEIEALEERVRKEFEAVKPTVLSYAEEQKKRITLAAEECEERMKGYEAGKKQELESRLEGQLGLKRKRLENELASLMQEKDKLTRCLEIRKTNFRDRLPAIESILERYFPDYDRKDGDEEDITSTVRRNYAAEIADALSGQVAFDETAVKNLMADFSGKVKRSAGKKFSQSDMKSIVHEVLFLISRIHPHQMDVLRRSIACARFRKSPSVEELHDYLAPLFKKT